MGTTTTINDPTDVPAALRHPSAFLPITMSLLALSLVLFHLLMYGTAREPDEGTVAHLWQLLMGLQVPIIAFFAIRRLPVSPRSAIAVLGLQLVAGVAAAAPVFYFHL
jgi:ABC-type Na+ efflux pump permease subunit